jgi:dCTP deaminase
MILSDKVIKDELLKGKVIIAPFEEKYLNPVSVDLTLAPSFKIYKTPVKKVFKDQVPQYILDKEELYFIDSHGMYVYTEPLDPRKPNEVEEFTIPDYGCVLMPGDVYLYAVNERIGVKGNIRAKVEGKSSLGRLGLFIHITAGFIDPGFEGSLVLELVATRPILVYPNMKICQLEFARVEGEIEESYDQKAGSKYHGQTGVQESKYHQNYSSESGKSVY